MFSWSWVFASEPRTLRRTRNTRVGMIRSRSRRQSPTHTAEDSQAPGLIRRPFFFFRVIGRLFDSGLRCLFGPLVLIGCMAAGSAQAQVVYLQGSGNPTFNQRFSDILQEHLGPDVQLRPFNQRSLTASDSAPVVTLGPEALVAVMEAGTSNPVIALLVNQRLISGLVTGNNRQLTGLYYDPPLLRQVLIGRTILPQATRVALLARPDDVTRYDGLIEQLAQFELEARVFVVAGDDVLIQTLTRALSFGDFLLATPDDVLYNPRTIKHILLTTYRRNRLVVGPGHAFVRAGVLASSFAPLADYAREAAELTREYLDTGVLPAPAFPDMFDVEVNHQVARSLNIPLPDEALIVEEVRRLLEHTAQGGRP